MIIPDLSEEQVQSENWKVEWILSHLSYLPFSSDERESIRSEFEYYMTSERLQELYELVNRNIPEPIESGLNYGQGDILRKLRQIERDSRK